MKKILLSVCAGFLLIAAGCKSGPSSSDPKDTLTGFFKALSQKDFKEARKYATKESESMFSIMEMAMQQAKSLKTEDPEEELKKYNDMVIGDPQIDGDRALVPVTSKTEKEATNFVLKKQDGAWKVAFDKATMAEMAADKMKDSPRMDVDSAMKELQDVNTDSLRAVMEQGMKTIDSMKKAMKQ